MRDCDPCGVPYNTDLSPVHLRLHEQLEESPPIENPAAKGSKDKSSSAKIASIFEQWMDKTRQEDSVPFMLNTTDDQLAGGGGSCSTITTGKPTMAAPAADSEDDYFADGDNFDLPDDFNPFELEFTTLGEAKEQVADALEENSDPDSKKVSLKSTADVGPSARKRKYVFHTDDEGGGLSSDSDDPLDDPTFDQQNRLCCPLCRFKTKCTQSYQCHIAKHTGRRRRNPPEADMLEAVVKRTRRRRRNPLEADMVEAVPDSTSPKESKPSTSTDSIQARMKRGPYKKRNHPTIRRRRAPTMGLRSPPKTGFKFDLATAKSPPKVGFKVDLTAKRPSPKAGYARIDLDAAAKYNGGEDFISCGRCAFTTNKYASFRAHMFTHKKEFSCRYCSYRTTNSVLFERHKDVHADLKKLNCPHCRFTTTNQRYFKVHRAAHRSVKLWVIG